MKIPFPYDVIGYWTAKYDIQLNSEAYQELAELFNTYSVDLLDIRKEIAEGESIVTVYGGYVLKRDVLKFIDSKLK